MSKKTDHLNLVLSQGRESIVIEGGTLKNNTFLMALDCLMRHPFEQDVAYQLGKLTRRLQVIANTFDEDGKKIVMENVEKDENGKPKMVTEIQKKKVKDAEGKEEEKEVSVPVGWVWKGSTPEEKKETENKVESECEKIYYKKYPIDVYKFNRGEFLGCRLTLAQWYALAPILANPVKPEEDHTHLACDLPSNKVD